MESDIALKEALEKCRQGKCSIDEMRTLVSDIGIQRFEPGISVLVLLLDHEDEIVRYHAVISLGFNLKYKPASDKLLFLLKEDCDEDVRDAAAGALAQLWAGTRERRILEPLAHAALEDLSEDLRKSSYRAMLLVNGVNYEEYMHLLVQENIAVDPSRIHKMLAEISG